ncbi:MAG TPA: UDP-N-acetylmuramoyl-L-alanine--D-glutamate ligase [Salinivirgaceae bacterium]|nr:UDP-N-acetylmuramoyl-L-alanine--D-glutamate ligase [Salinivirgaceae bacterium]
MSKYYDIVILGAGESGVGAALLAQKLGYRVFVSDMAEIKENFKNELAEYNIPFEEKHHTIDIVTSAPTIIKSPGIPDKAPVVIAAKEAGCDIIGEIEFAARYSKAKFVAITGSNGKTTTTLLTYHIFKQAGLDVGLAGNVGQSLARQVLDRDHEWFVVELSSFQLDSMTKFKAHIAIITNITPDHLDRYEYKFENYINSKFRILQNQTESDYFIFFDDDPVVKQQIEQRSICSQKCSFTLKNNQTKTGYCQDNQIVINFKNNKLTMFYDELLIKGKHNRSNALAAAIAAQIANIKNETIKQSLQNFMGVEHRLEPYLSIQGVLYINDSKATNVNSTWFALDSMDRPTIWIAGGVDKGNDYSELDEVVHRTVKAIVCLGVDNQKIINHFKNIVPVIIETRSMPEAVKKSYELAVPGDVVLLSPACASFDLFKNYEDRGQRFKDCVRQL